MTQSKVFIVLVGLLAGIILIPQVSFGRVDDREEVEGLTLGEERDIVKQALKEAFAEEIKVYPLLGAFFDLKIDAIFDRIIKVLKKRGLHLTVANARGWIIQNKNTFMRQEGIGAFIAKDSYQAEQEIEYLRKPTSEEPAKSGEPCNPNIPSYSQKGCVHQD